MDMNVLRGLATVVVMSSFFGICWWVYFYRSKEHFSEAEQLPFIDDVVDVNQVKDREAQQ